MTLSSDDLPAPFGPMMARTSPLRMSKLTLVSARTPPKRKEMSSTASRTSPSGRPARISGCLPQDEGVGAGAANGEIGLKPALAPVLERDLALDTNGGGARVDRLDQRRVTLVDHLAAHLAGSRQLAVVGVELLVEEQEACDPLRLRQGRVHLLDLAGKQLLDLGVVCQRLVGRKADLPVLGPLRHHRVADAQDGGDVRAPVAEHDALADERRELQLVLDKLRAEARSGSGVGDVTDPVDHSQPAFVVQEPRVAGMQPTLAVQGLTDGSLIA